MITIAARSLASSSPVSLSLAASTLASRLSILKQLLLIDEEDIILRNDERRARQVLHANIIFLVFQLLRHPFLRLCQRHAVWNHKHQPEAFSGRRHMDENNEVENSLVKTFLLLLPPSSRVRYMILVIDGKPAGDGSLVRSPTILEGGMRRQDRQTFLQLRFQGFKILLAHLASASALQSILYLCADILHHFALNGLVEKLGSANLHCPAHHAI